MDLSTLFGKRSPGSESESEGSLPSSSTAPRSDRSTTAPNSRGEWPADGSPTPPPLRRNPSFFDDRGLPPRPGYVPLTRKRAGKGRHRRGLKKKTRRMKSRRRRV